MRFVRTWWVLALLLPVVVSGCGEDYEPQVIEQTTFAPSLGVNLAEMTRLDVGVYVKDIVVGAGDELLDENIGTADYTLWLSDGTMIDTGTGYEFAFSGEVIPITGFLHGVLGMRVGGTRLILIPPDLGYGDRDSGLIPAGSILVFQVVLTGVS